MLSKYLYRGEEASAEADPAIGALLSERLTSKYGPCSIEPMRTNGTLGVFFKCRIDGMDAFLKTHRDSERCANNLRKEGEILKRLYGQELLIDLFDLGPASPGKWFLLEEELRRPAAAPSPGDVASLVESYGERLSSFRLNSVGRDAEHERLEFVITAADECLEIMGSAGMVDADVRAEIARIGAEIKASVLGRAPVVCHGDLSDKNILQKGSRLYAIDWEDAITGIGGYDYLYWMTFFSKRGLYHGSSVLAPSGLPRSEAVFLMLVIVVVKCFISWKNGTYLYDSLDFSRRLREILAIMG